MKVNNPLGCINVAVGFPKVKKWLEVIDTTTDIDLLNLQLRKLYDEDPILFQLLCVIESTKYLGIQIIEESDACFDSISRIWECIDND